MKKRILSIICLMAIMVGCFAAGVYGANNIEEIKAYLNYGITIKYDGQVQSMYDANGKQVYPISYEGTTYVPIRAVSNMLDVNVDWDGANNTVLLGENSTAKDFLVDFEPYDRDGAYRMTTNDNSPKEIMGETYYNYISMGNMSHDKGKLYYNLEGKYKHLILTVYNMGDDDNLLEFYGDNNKILKSELIISKNVPTQIIVDVTNVTQLTLKGHRNIYILGGTIQ